MPEMKFKRKKNVRYQGSKTHGGGSMKKRRGAGHRGGRGNAGSGKRGDSNKPTFINAKRRFGRFGFVNPTTKTITITNVGQVQQSFDKKSVTATIDLTKMGIDKLLGNGEVTSALNITVRYVSPSAKAKIEKAGGAVITPQQTE